MDRGPHIINVDELDQQPFPAPMPDGVKERYGGATIGFVGPRIGAQKIGSNVTVLPPGKRAFPFHSHRVNEELFFVLEGEGEVRLGADRYPIRKGDFICAPAGGTELAHQIINTSDAPLSYIALSTKLSPEIADYPDTGKFGVLAENFRFVGKLEDGRDYWEGE